MSSPLVSVVIPTWNRSNVLRFTLEALLASTLRDFEAIIVGDCCTDDTEDVVRSFADARLRFVNLATNHGEQSVPNNEGVRLASGRYLAFLNHDDLWIPRHLELAVSAIETSGADLVFSETLVIEADEVPHLLGASRTGRYSPYLFAPASSWLMRRELADAVGPWPPAREVWASPSQEWLFRAWRAGHALHATNVATVIAITSGRRQGSYAERQSDINAHYAGRLRNDPSLMPELIGAIATRNAAGATGTPVLGLFRTAARNLLRRLAVAAGMHPMALRNLLIHRRRGGFIDHLRRIRGLTPLPGRRTDD